MAKRVTQPAVASSRRAASKAAFAPDFIQEALQQLPAEVLRRFMEQEIAANPMFGFRFGVMSLLQQRETNYGAYLDLIRRTFKRLETEEGVFGSLMTAPGFGGFEGMPNFGGPTLTMREQTMAELSDTLLAAANAAYSAENLPLALAPMLAGVIGDMELAETRTWLVAQIDGLPLMALVGRLLQLTQDASDELAATGFEALMAIFGHQKGFPKFAAAESLLLRVVGGFVRTDAQHQRLVALFGVLAARSAAEAPKRGAVLTTAQAQITVLLLHAQYLAEMAERPAEARQLFEANLGLGPEVRERYLQLLGPPEALAALLHWTGPGAPSWAVGPRPQLLHDLVQLAEAQGRPDVVREASRRQLLELLTGPYHQQGLYQIPWQRLRATYSADEWPTVRPQHIAELQARVPHQGSGPAADPRRRLTLTFDRLDADTDRRLAELRKRPRFDGLRGLGAFWLPAHAAELAALYARAVPDFLEDSNNKNAPSYQLVAQTLWRLLQHVEAEEPVVALVENLAATYPRRRLLLDSLRAVGFSFGPPAAAPHARLGPGNGADGPLAPPRKPGRRGR